MARLPSVSDRPAILQGPQSSVTAAAAANPYMQIADAFGTIGTKLEEQQVIKADQEGANAVYRNPEGTLQVDTRSNWTKSGQAYNRAAQQAYSARIAGDIRSKGQNLFNDAKGDVKAFDESWKGFTNTLLKSTPKEYRGPVQTMLDSEGSRFSLGVSEQKRKRDLQTFEADIKTEASYLDDEMAALARGGGTNTPAYLEKQSQLKSLYSELAANPEFSVSEKQATMELDRIASRHSSEALIGQIDKTLATGGVAAAQKDAQRLLTDESLKLSPSERRQYANIATERIHGFVAQQKVALKPVQDASSNYQKMFDQGVGIDNPEVDTTIATLARGGDVAGALELSAARNTARTIANFKLADPASRVGALERGISAANGVNLNPQATSNIISNIIGVESSNNPNAESPKGASGLMGVMPATGVEIAQEIGDAAFPVNGTEAQQKAYLKDPENSKRYGTHYFNKQLSKYNGDVEAALIAYNGGAERADKWLAAGRDDSVIPKESADYYKKVLGQERTFQSTGKTLGQSGPSEARQFLQSRTDKDASHIDNMDAGFGNKLAAMIQAAPPGIREGLGIYSGARSDERQAELWAGALKKYGSVAEARKWVAPPTGVEGSQGSQHNHGKAADLAFNGKSLAQAPQEVVDWVHQNAATFGLKFPLSNENWHVEDDSTRQGKGTVAPQAQISPEAIKEYRQGVTADAKALWPDIKAGITRGIPPTPEQFGLLSRQLAVIDDPNFKTEVSNFMQGSAAGAMIGALPPDQAASVISSLKADAADGASIAQQQIIEAADRTAKRTADALKNDPIGFATERGYSKPVPPIDLGAGPDAVGAAFSSRQTAVDLLRARGMAGNISALRPEDSALLAQKMTTSTPAEQAQLLGTMSKSLSPETYKATMADLGSKADTKSLATAGALYQSNPQAAEGVLRGRILLAQNEKLAPKKSDDNRASIDAILPTTAFGNGLEASRQGLLEAATARYADLSNIAGDTSGDLNDDRMTQAINEITGGMLDYNGKQIIAPRYGMGQNEFDKFMSELPDTTFNGAITSDGIPISASQAQRYGRLKAVADGQYLIEFGPENAPTYAMSKPVPGDSTLNRTGGGAFILDLRRSQ
nr:MAG TPA: hypothetical protein [Caudoviricetes sp.]